MIKLEAGKELIGQQVNISKTPTSWASNSGHVFESVNITINDPAMVERAVKLLGPGVRWRIPGRVYTQDFRPERANVRINEEGIITDVFNG